jgi:Protein of unknown function (DUF4242)
MTFSPAAEPDREASTFLVERYLPPAGAHELAASVARLARLCAEPEPAGHGVEYLNSAFLPGEDTCFCLFRAASAEAVREVNRQADFALDRVTDALLLFPTTEGLDR